MTFEQRLQGNKEASHASNWKSVLRRKANTKVLGWESTLPGVFEKQQGSQHG